MTCSGRSHPPCSFFAMELNFSHYHDGPVHVFGSLLQNPSILQVDMIHKVNAMFRHARRLTVVETHVSVAFSEPHLNLTPSVSNYTFPHSRGMLHIPGIF
jgi:hypothetical protein